MPVYFPAKVISLWCLYYTIPGRRIEVFFVNNDIIVISYGLLFEILYNTPKNSGTVRNRAGVFYTASAPGEAAEYCLILAAEAAPDAVVIIRNDVAACQRRLDDRHLAFSEHSPCDIQRAQI